MRLPQICISLAWVLLLASLVDAQDVVDDRGEGTINHNYFAAANSKAILDIVRNIETNHIDRCPHNNFNGGVMKDIANGRYDLAKQDLMFMLERVVNHPRALQIGIMLTKLSKDRKWLLDRFEYALRWYPNYAFTHAQYGSFLVEIGEVAGGVEKLEYAIKMDPKLVAGYVWLSKAYSVQGKPDLAREAANKAKELGYKGAL
jgi:tetratricopeptide (TPR) repeat protein